MTAEDVYGGPKVVTPTVEAGGRPPTDHGDRGDPHDKADRGSAHWFDDPVVWLVLIFGLATGVLGIRFRWWSGGVEAGARVNVGDEVTTLIGTTLYAITGIVLFKVLASKLEVPGLQKLAAAI